MAGWAREWMHTLRRLWHNPGFTWPVLAALALGIAATTSVFSIFSAMLLHPLGFGDSGRVIAIWAADPEHGQARVEVNYRDLQSWNAAKDTLESAALVSSVNLDYTLFAQQEPRAVDGATVSGSFFRVTGTKAFAGRLLNEEDDRPGVPVRAVLSHSLWRTAFRADYSVVGRELRVGFGNVTVVGIAPPEFDFPLAVSLWVPIRSSWPNAEKSPDLRVFRGIARLQNGVQPAQARLRLSVISSRLQSLRPSGSSRYGVSTTPILDEIYGSAKPGIQVLLGAVLLVMLIACANAGNLLLAGANARSGEIAIRKALGAGQRRIATLLLGEAISLGVVAGILGMLIALMATRLIASLAPVDVPRVADCVVDWRVLLFGILLTCSTVLLFGLAPGLTAAARDPDEALKRSGPRSSGSLAQAALRRLLIISQVAFSTFLLVGAAFLIRSYSKLAAVDPGFRPARVLTFRVTTEKPDNESRRVFYSAILDRLRALPGVESAAAILIRPLSGAVGWDTVYAAEGQTDIQRQANPNGAYQAISPDYFRTMGIRVIAGREFRESDNHMSGRVVIINAATAKRHWPHESALGKRIRLGNGPKSGWANVVGVVSDVRDREWESAQPEFYVPFLQQAQHRTDFVVKTHGDSSAMAEPARRAVLAVDKSQPISAVATMSVLVDRALARPRFTSTVLSGLAVCAILLAMLGIYSVLSYLAGESAFEIALRIAVGAMPWQVSTMLAARGLRPVLAGAAAGLVAAAVASRLLTTLLFGVSALDLRAYAFAIAILVLAAGIAIFQPARRASVVDPIRSLRSGG